MQSFKPIDLNAFVFSFNFTGKERELRMQICLEVEAQIKYIHRTQCIRIFIEPQMRALSVFFSSFIHSIFFSVFFLALLQIVKDDHGDQRVHMRKTKRE